MKLLKTEKGMSLVAVMVAAGIMGIVAMGIMNISERLSSIQINSTSLADLNDLREEFKFFFNKSNVCRANILHSIPNLDYMTMPRNRLAITPDPDNPNPPAVNPEYPIELFRVNNAGARTTLKFSHTDPTTSKYGLVKIRSLEVIIPDGVPVPNGIYVENAQIVLQGRRKVSAKRWVPIKPIIQRMQLTLDRSGATTTVTDCRTSGFAGTSPPVYNARNSDGSLGRYDLCLLSGFNFELRRGKRSRLNCSLNLVGGEWFVKANWNEMRSTGCHTICFNFR